MNDESKKELEAKIDQAKRMASGLSHDTVTTERLKLLLAELVRRHGNYEKPKE